MSHLDYYTQDDQVFILEMTQGEIRFISQMIHMFDLSVESGSSWSDRLKDTLIAQTNIFKRDPKMFAVYQLIDTPSNSYLVKTNSVHIQPYGAR